MGRPQAKKVYETLMLYCINLFNCLGKFTTRHVVNRVESPFAPFLQNIVKLAKELKMKMKPKPGGRKDKLLLEIAQVKHNYYLKLTNKK